MFLAQEAIMLFATARGTGLWHLACMFVASPYAVNAMEAVSTATSYRTTAFISLLVHLAICTHAGTSVPG